MDGKQQQQQQPNEEGWDLSILIFDAIQIGSEDFVQMQLPPAERYRRLRKLCTETANVLSSSCMKLQWAGEYAALEGFCMGPGSDRNLAHIPDCFFRYTRQHPCKIVMLE